METLLPNISTTSLFSQLRTTSFCQTHKTFYHNAVQVAFAICKTELDGNFDHITIGLADLDNLN